MASNIDATKPVAGSPTTASVRANFAAAKAEIEALQQIIYTIDNDIGEMGGVGAGVGIAPEIPAGLSKLDGTTIKGHDNYGNYINVNDGSIVVYIPAFWYKWGTGSNGLAINQVDIKPYSYFPDVATANAAGYAIHRAFWNAGAIRPGVFCDKYQCSNNDGIASSIKNGNPLSSDSAHNPFSGLNGSPANNYGGAFAAAKTRGSKWFPESIFIKRMRAMLSLAHAQASTSTTYCAWYDAAGVTNFPKGNNNNALRDTNDTSVLYVSDGYSNCGKTGSATLFAKTTHNGQNCGVADDNGNMWEIAPGITSDGNNFYLWKTSTDAAIVTGGNTLATDAFGAAGIAALYDSIGATYGAVTASSTVKTMGSASKVFDEAASGTGWAATGAGIPLVAGGSNVFGSDGLWDYRNNELCAISGGSWGTVGGAAGVWALYLDYVRSNSSHAVGLRCAMYL